MTKENANLANRLSPKEYRARLEKIDIQSIYLVECSLKLKKEKLSKALEVDVDTVKSSYNQTDENIIEIMSSYKVIAYAGKKTNYAVMIKATFILSILAPDGNFDDDFFEIFKEVNLPLNVWPYLREFVQSMTYRMNLPPLTLPFYRS